MANRPTERPSDPQRQQPPAAPDQDMSREDQRDMGGRTGQQRAQERGTPDRVEIGDPVPENDRTVRADETGEDEDLPGSDRGETGEDEDLPSGDVRH